MTGDPTPSGPKFIPPFVFGCTRASRICSSIYGHVASASLEAQVASVALIDSPAMGEAESPLSPFVYCCRCHIIQVSVKLFHGAQGHRRVVIRDSGGDSGASAVEYRCCLGASERATTGSRGAFNHGLGVYEVILPFRLCLVRNWELILLVLRCGGAVFYQCGYCRYGCKPFVGDW